MIADILMSKESIFYITLISILLFVIIFGILLNNLCLNYFNFKVSDLIFKFTEYGAWDVNCDAIPRWKTPIPVQFIPHRDPIEYAIKSNKNLSSWCFNILCSPTLLFIKSSESLNNSIDILITGIFCLGLSGFIIYISRQINVVVAHGGGGNMTNLGINLLFIFIIISLFKLIKIYINILFL
jgi:hypothetical protein